MTRTYGLEREEGGGGRERRGEEEGEEGALGVQQEGKATLHP